MQAAPLLKDLVLVGGGHSHVHVVRSFGMKPMPGVRLTLIGRDIETPYSGMIPGFVAGTYTFDECHIDLARLCAWNGARLIHAEAVGLDRLNRQVLLKDRPPVSYDLVSLDVGSSPSMAAIAGAAEHATPVKPIAELGRRWLGFLERVKDWQGALDIAVIGGGAGGVELALAIDHRLRQVARGAQVSVTLATKGEILSGQAVAARQRMRAIFGRRGVRLIEHTATTRIDADAVHLENGERLRADDAFVVTQASAAAWFAETGLSLDERGFFAVEPTLASSGDPSVFAAGDCASVTAHPRPKAGVFAVRHGPPLAENLRLALLGQPPRPFTPQRRYLSILGTGDGNAVATRGGFAIEGAWVWRWKDHIDRKWMRMYREPPAAPMDRRARTAPPDPALADADARRLLADIGMRCGGCGAKVGAGVLDRVLARLGPSPGSSVAIGLDAPDDAAMIEVPPGQALVQSVDFFRTFIDDPFVFGEVAAVHALGDVWAMGARPHSALALAVVPAAAERLMEEDLFQMLAGARRVLDGAGCALIGGHSGEGPEAALGFSVNGLVVASRALRKGGLRPGDRLVLTKKLGTGVIFAAAMRGMARAAWIEAALASMRTPSGAAAQTLLDAGAHACTDVTGFGLAGHIAEMIRASGNVAVDIDLDALPALPGATELFAQGFASSLQPENLRARHLIDGMDRAASHSKLPLLFDPQTAGGLLAALPADAPISDDMTHVGTVRAREENETNMRIAR
ncbi:selenide, water dikinase SelD [Reyranella aquatilis]|uniref:Selenide, water dikinase SelD n=1 Tax=Reyranella aquatilis TaxID=2035356 RepID=A0ABS8L462_9HYPH|nr:selenide, water dikinase SelD [Reyranella aquatilis]MCC8432571.1 selenide, water dikinase SelD [Reyranella aquatilis]